MKTVESSGALGGDTGSASLPMICNFWKDFDLDAVRKNLDEVGLKVAQYQEESGANRKKLAEATRKFKRTVSEQDLQRVQGLLKMYQDEVDRLTRRAKNGEAAFLDIYQKLYEAPDPAAALSESLEAAVSFSDREAQMQKMAQELADFHAESKHIKNQGLTIRKLEDKVAELEQQLKEGEVAIATAKQDAAELAASAEVEELKEREVRLTESLAEAQDALRASERAHQRTQNKLFALVSSREEAAAGADSVAELSAAEAERMEAALHALEAENESLKRRLSSAAAAAAAAAAPPPPKASALKALEEELDVSRKLVATLRDEAAHVAMEKAEAESTWEHRAAALRSALEAQEAHAAALEQQLETRPTDSDVASLRQKVAVLQSALGFEEEPTAGDLKRSASNRPLNKAGNLETVLIQKNRTLEHDMTMLRLNKADLQQKLDDVSGELDTKTVALNDAHALIARLEADITAAEAALAARPEADAEGSGAAGLQDEDEEENTMVNVLCSQRDRFKHKAQRAEEESSRARTDLNHMRSELNAARADNVALVERIRFLQGYSAHGDERHAGAGRANKAEARYASEYEAVVDPFKEFQGREREARRKAMGITDRAVYGVGQIVLSNSWARAVALLYALIMHLLVFALITKLSHAHSHMLHRQHVLCEEHAHLADPRAHLGLGLNP